MRAIPIGNVPLFGVDRYYRLNRSNRLNRFNLVDGWGIWWGCGHCGMEMNKKSASPKKNCAYRKQLGIVRIKGGIFLPVGICHNRPSEAHGFGCGGLQAALQAAPSLVWNCPRYAISDGGFAASPPDFLFFSISPGSISPGTIPAHQSPAIKRAPEKMQRCRKAGCAILVHNFASWFEKMTNFN